MKIGILGGGNVGTALAGLFAHGGHETRVGVRDPARQPASGAATVTLEQAAVHGDVVLVAVPFTAATAVLQPLATHLESKILVDATNPLNADWSPLLLGQESSAAEEIARSVPLARVVKAFNTVFADVMRADRLDRSAGRVTTFVAGDDPDAVAVVSALARDAGFSPVEAGPLRVARYLEALAHLNIQLAVGCGGGTNAAFVYDRARS